MNEAESKTFLNNFPPLKRSLVMNQFLAAIREGKVTTADEILAWVHQDTLKRRNNKWADEEARTLQIDLSSRLLTDEAMRLAEYCLWYESLSALERDQLKAYRGQEYQRQWMEKQPPTVKQLDYLQVLGCAEIPSNRLEASEWIEKFKSA